MAIGPALGSRDGVVDFADLKITVVSKEFPTRAWRNPYEGKPGAALAKYQPLRNRDPALSAVPAGLPKIVDENGEKVEIRITAPEALDSLIHMGCLA